MKESDLLQYCRYYKGERKNPYEGKEQNKAMLWMYERAWIHDTMAVIARGDANVYEVPITLKSLLFNRYAQGNMSSLADCVEPFKKFYKQYYG